MSTTHLHTCRKHSQGCFNPFDSIFKCSKEHPCPPRLQRKTWRNVGVLTGIMSTNFLETYRKHSQGCYNPFDSISKCLRNVHVIQGYRRRLRGQEESWQAFCQQIIFKVVRNISRDVSTLLTPSASVSGTPMSSKTLGGDLEDRQCGKLTPGQ